MFARIVEFVPKLEKKEDFLKVMKNEVLPILKKQNGFLEILPFVPELHNEKMITITLWHDKKDADRYVRDVFPKVEEIVRPYMTTPITWRAYTVETSLCEHFVETLAA